MAIMASGLVGLLLAVPGATPVVTVLAAAYFVCLAWRIATAPPLADDGGDRHSPSFPGGFCCRWSIPRAMRRWRRCSRASCCCATGWRSMPA